MKSRARYRTCRTPIGPDWARWAALLCARTGLIEADDLLQEAFRRALDGRRSCPAHVGPVKFLAEAMRSIADGELRRKFKAQPRLVPIANHGGDETVVDPPDSSLDPEQRTGSAEECSCDEGVLGLTFRGR